MSYERDPDSVTRGVGAIASLDHTNARQYQNRLARMRAMRVRDRKMAAVAMGALGATPGSRMAPRVSAGGTRGPGAPPPPPIQQPAGPGAQQQPAPQSPQSPGAPPRNMRDGTGTITLDHRKGANPAPVYDATAVHPTNTKPVYNPVTNKLVPYGTDPRAVGPSGVVTTLDHRSGTTVVTTAPSNDGRNVFRFGTHEGVRTKGTNPATPPAKPPAPSTPTGTDPSAGPAPITNTPAVSSAGGGGGVTTGQLPSPISMTPSPGPGIDLPDATATSSDDMTKYAVIGGIALVGLFLMTRGRR
jgi:hypothetical protein